MPTKKILIFCFFLLFLIITGAAFMANSSAEKETTAFFDPHAQTGNLPGRSKEEIQAELDKIVEAGMFNISIASVVNMRDGDEEARVRIENIAANHHHMKVIITIDGETEPVYESAGLAPGQYIEAVSLKRKLSAGTYPATAVFTAYNTDDLSPAGEAAARITIVVGS